MKKWLAAIVLLLILTVPVRAAGADADTRAMEESVEGEEMPFGSVGEIFSAVLENRLSLDGRNVADSILSLLFLAFRRALPYLTGLFAVGVLLSLAKNLEILQGGLEDAALLGGKLAFAVLLLSASLSFVKGASEAVSAAARFASAATPPLVTLLVSCGATGTASIVTPSVTLLSSTMMTLVVRVLFPLLLASLLLSVLDSVLPQSRLSSLAGFLKSGASWLLGGSFSVFAGILSVQGLTGGLRDGATLRSVKYALNTSVPVIGGAVTESLSALMAGASVTKGAIGVTGIIVIAGILLVPLVNLTAFLFSLQLLAACMAPFAGTDLLRPVHDACACLRLVVGALAGVGVLWFLFLGILIGAGGV